MKNVVFMGFSGVQLEIARKFRTFHRHDHLYHVHAGTDGLQGHPDAIVLNCSDDMAIPRVDQILHQTRLPVLGIGAQRTHNCSEFVKGPYTPMTAQKLAEVLERPAEQQVVARPTGVSSETRSNSSISVLVVDDSVSVRNTMLARLASLGHSVDIATHGMEALSKIEKKQYALVFMDVMMPGIDGFETCKRIKKSAAAGGCSVYMLTSKDGMFDKVRGALSGCDGYLVKPLEPDKLLEVLKKHLTSSTPVPQPA